MMKKTCVLALAMALFGATGLSAQAADWPEPDPADVESVDALIAAVYDVISGPAGEARDWERFKSLFTPDARLIPTGRNPQGQGGYQAWTPEQYAEMAGPLLMENGFFESEIGRVTEQYGGVIHLMSAYDSRYNADDPEPFTRGVNSFQIFFDGQRYRVMTIFWEGESPANPIPARFLSGIN